MNISICLTLIIITICAIKTLRQKFSTTFEREIRLINTILITFTVCFMLRTGYEAFENIRNIHRLRDGKYVSQFVVDVETMLLELFFVDTEIFVICCLHVMHSKHNNRRRNSLLSPRAKDKKNLRDSIWLQSNSCISENWR